MKSSTGGFTIIETLIVLAIAGLILLIVFEAIPSLERSGRNNQRKQDVQTILEAVSHYELNDSGSIPVTGSNFLQYQAKNITFYDPTAIQYLVPGNPVVKGSINVYADSAGTPSAAGPETDITTVDIYNYQKCNANTPGKSTSTGAGYNDIVALYALETNSGVPVSLCQQL